MLEFRPYAHGYKVKCSYVLNEAMYMYVFIMKPDDNFVSGSTQVYSFVTKR